MVVLAEHYLEVIVKPPLLFLLTHSLHRLRVDRHSAIPVILDLAVVKCEVPLATGGRFIYVLELVLELRLALLLVKELLVVSVCYLVGHAVRNVAPFVPGELIFFARH